MVVGAVLAILAVVPFVVWPVYRYFAARAVSAALFERVKALVEKHPELKPDWAAATQDGVLTFDEAKAIVEKAGETVEPEQ